jgi:hypothetical protein
MNHRIAFGGVKALTDMDVSAVSGCDAQGHAASRMVASASLLHRRE